ncbi:MAG: adenosylcobinamide amidohydrolase [Deltaproteobacteria bacterium]|jgi:adenosylcobinamide amidohydrolase|nr:adenosylcobinamide amidohydrolase [Deltaproteobacteria bacterium]
MLLGKFYDSLELHREEKIVYAKFLTPHTVISTSRSGGGLRQDLQFLFNHQACEPAGHGGAKVVKGYTKPEEYLKDICAKHNLPPDSSAFLTTAANMRLVAVESLTFKELTVVAAVTGGVQGNAGRAGDPASGYEGREGYEPLAIPVIKGVNVPEGASGLESEALPRKDEGQNSHGEVSPPHGTINTLLFISLPVTPGALVRSIMTATEAKSAALQELNVNSRYSDGLSTGTGTDQIGVASRDDPNFPALSSSGKHSKLGELIGLTVKKATKEVLIRQNGMTVDRQCSVKILMERFFQKEDGHHGIHLAEFADFVSSFAPNPEIRELLKKNALPIFHDPVVVAATAAIVHIRDEFAWGILPPLIWGDVMPAFAAQLAAAVSGNYEKIPAYRELFTVPSTHRANEDFVAIVGRALAQGFFDKWEWGD